jgi:hypothetical protein
MASRRSWITGAYLPVLAISRREGQHRVLQKVFARGKKTYGLLLSIPNCEKMFSVVRPFQ